MKNIWFFLIGWITFSVVAQQKNAYALDSVYLKKKNEYKKANCYNTSILKIIYKPIDVTESIAATIPHNRAVFIREYGRGMLAGISLRGTGTSHTQVVWNGIPVNSILNGQTDLNTLNAGNSYVKILKGGNSTEYGSGAIGGVILIDNPITFNKPLQLINTVNIGSFKSLGNNFNLSTSNHKIFAQINWHINQSKNDYPFVGFAVKNENGAFQNIDLGTVLAFKINRNNQVYFKQNATSINRQLARSLYMISNSKLLQTNHRNLWGWQYSNSNFSTRTDLAYLFESYDYYFNRNTDKFSRSTGNVYMIKNRLQWQFSPEKSLQLGNEFTYQKGSGENIPVHDRKLYAAYALWQQKGKAFDYNLQMRKEFTAQQNIPLTGGIETTFHWKNRHKTLHQVQFKASRNFRLPTFNDLYWNPGGNPDLLPEISLNLDAGYQIESKKAGFFTSLTAFYIKSTDLIKWTPDSSQMWSPKNFEKVNFRGIEFSLKKFFGAGKKLSAQNRLEYTYQEPLNKKTAKFLPYTPNHILVNNLDIYYLKWTLTYNYRYQGKMYTTTSNTKYLPAYQIHRLSLLFNLDKHWQLQGNIDNIFNVYYESFPSHPQPGRNYQFIINYKIK